MYLEITLYYVIYTTSNTILLHNSLMKVSLNAINNAITIKDCGACTTL